MDSATSERGQFGGVVVTVPTIVGLVSTTLGICTRQPRPPIARDRLDTLRTAVGPT